MRLRFFVATTLSVVASHATPAQRAVLAIRDVTVIDGTGSASRPHMTVIVRAGRIVSVDSSAHARVPTDALIVDGRGKFLIPGLWDMHVHLAKTGADALGLFVANGVTSVRDMGGDFAVVQRWRSEIDGRTRIGPRIRTAGPILERAERVRRMKERNTVEPVDRFRAPIGDASDAPRVVDSLARLGVDFIKVRTASPSAFQAIAMAAQRAGLPLAAHGDVVPIEDMIRLRQRSIEHAITPSLQKRDSANRARLIAELVGSRVAVVPTMLNYYQWLIVPPSQARRIVEDTLGLIDARRRYVHGYLLEDWREQVAERGRVMDALIRRFYLPRIYRDVLRDLQDMHHAGVRILPGTDAAVALSYPGFSLREELGYFVSKIGMTPMQALLSATRWSAEFSGMQDSLGTIEVGKLADLVLLDASPLLDIRNVGQIHAVIIRGDVLDRARLVRLLSDG